MNSEKFENLLNVILDDNPSKKKLDKLGMTKEELENPKIIKSSRIKRVARGSGRSPEEVRALLKHYNHSKKAIKGFSGNRKMQRKLMKQLESGGLDL